MICETVEELTPIIGTRLACRALGASPATIYRRRRPPEPKPRRPRPKPARSLGEAERDAALEALHDERFVDASPAAVWATSLDEGAYLCWERTTASRSPSSSADHRARLKNRCAREWCQRHDIRVAAKQPATVWVPTRVRKATQSARKVACVGELKHGRNRNSSSSSELGT